MAAKKKTLATDSARFTLRLPLDCELDSEVAEYLYSHEKGTYRAEAIRGLTRAGFSLLLKHKSEQESFMDMQTMGYDNVFNKGKPTESKVSNELRATNELLTQQLKSKDEQLQQMQMQLANIQNSFNSLLAMLSTGNMQMQQAPMQQAPMQMPQQMPQQMPTHIPQPTPVTPYQTQEIEQQESESNDNNSESKFENNKEIEKHRAEQNNERFEAERNKEPVQDSEIKSANADFEPSVASAPARPVFTDLDDDDDPFDEEKVSGILDDLQNDYEETFSIDDDLVDPLDGFINM